MNEMAMSGNKFLEKDALRTSAQQNTENNKAFKKELLKNHAKFGYGDVKLGEKLT